MKRILRHRQEPRQGNPGDRAEMLGKTIRDKITGFTGVAVAYTAWLNGCDRVGIQTTKLHEGKPLDIEWFDIVQLEIIEPPPTPPLEPDNEYRRTTGGPKRPVAPSRDPR